MRKVILFTVILFASVGMAFPAMPDWAENPYYGYSKTDYVCAAGFGKTQSEADMNAKKEIAGFFGTTVSSSTEIYASESSIYGASASFSSTASAKVNVDDIVGIEIDKRTKDGNQFISHAVLAKKPALTFYAGRLMNSAMKIADYEQLIMSELGSMYALGDLSELAKAYDKYQKDLRIYNAISTTPFVSAQTESMDINMISQLALSSIEVSIKVSGDVDGKIESAIKSFITGCGLSISRRNATNKVNVDITLENAEVKGNPYKFCRYSIKVSVFDETFGEQIFEFSASGREGQNSYDQAKTRAVNSMEKIITSEFADRFEEEFGIRPRN